VARLIVNRLVKQMRGNADLRIDQLGLRESAASELLLGAEKHARPRHRLGERQPTRQ
jgi:hypothetical protein